MASTYAMEKIILIDVDGCLTDGKVWITSKGERTKGFHTRDIRAIKELVSNGWEVHLVTASTWKGINSYCEKVGAMPYVCRDKSKVPFENYVAVADDSWDVEMLRNAKRKFCPKDAHHSVKQLEGIEVLSTEGGNGVIDELVNILIK